MNCLIMSLLWCSVEFQLHALSPRTLRCCYPHVLVYLTLQSPCFCSLIPCPRQTCKRFPTSLACKKCLPSEATTKTQRKIWSVFLLKNPQLSTDGSRKEGICLNNIFGLNLEVHKISFHTQQAIII